jgi:two-component system phosphate regulon sensor histidine kinase PhoR
MGSSLRKVSLLILLIIVLPVMIFSVFEIGNLRQNEKVIQNIYKNQLDAILFSINQYSDDIVSNLASRVENNLNNYNSDSAGLNKIINEFQVNCLIHFNKKLEFISSEPNSYRDSTLVTDIRAMIENNYPVIDQLKTYLRAGYRKICSA